MRIIGKWDPFFIQGFERPKGFGRCCAEGFERPKGNFGRCCVLK
ncbi:hypothetical protein FGIG_03045 [Fasciola gigantica]|uniref:Uncharacterized protein n=1 Tax=Fasciola gigantica TaxID=46835 RepID=A0A504YYG4_FASGI|nr:hypothetical protein FGIG_03045 [Fasciola gigantica]